MAKRNALVIGHGSVGPMWTKHDEEILDFFDDLFKDFPILNVKREFEGLPVNIYTNKNGDLKYEIAVTGYGEEEIEVSVEDGSLVVKCTPKENASDEWELVHGRIKRMNFEHRLKVSNRVDCSKATASIKGGLVTIIIPSKDELKARKLEIKRA